jgi:hypothetical protein
MKLQAKLVNVASKLMKSNLLLTTALLAAPFLAQSQPGEPPAGGTPDVPFDSNLNLMFLAAGLAFAVFITIKQVRKKAEH